MNNECLVTTLRGTATGKNLRKLNEIVFDIVARPNATKEMGDKVRVNLSVTDVVTVTLEEAYFTDEKGTNLGNTHQVVPGNIPFYLKIENEHAKIKMDNKFHLTGLGFSINSFWAPYNGITCKYIPKLNVKEFKYLKLQHINESFMLEGDIADLNAESLTYLSFTNPYKTVDTKAENLPQKLSGDGSHLLSKLTNFSFTFTNISFDITKLNPSVAYVQQWEADMRGDISNLSFPNVTAIYLGASSFLTPMALTGKVDKLTRTNPNNHLLVLRAVPNITGNVGALGKNCYGFSPHPDARFTYTKVVERPYVLALNGAYLESGLDDYLNDMAKLEMNPAVKSGALSKTWKNIYVEGERSAASNDAVKTLIAKGFLVEVNGETLK